MPIPEDTDYLDPQVLGGGKSLRDPSRIAPAFIKTELALIAHSLTRVRKTGAGTPMVGFGGKECGTETNHIDHPEKGFWGPAQKQ